MKVLHITYSFQPDPVGGTEIYVSDLCQALGKRGVNNVVAAPAATNDAYEVNGVPVRRFEATLNGLTRRALYGDGDARAARAFERILDDEAPDVVHQHALSPAASVRLLRAAKHRGIATVVTYHTPAVSCQRGTMLRWGKTPCDGTVDAVRCAACTLHGLGMPKLLARGFGRMPVVVSGWISERRAAGHVSLALSMTSLLALKRERLEEFLALADRVVVVAPWVKHVLERNGACPEQLVDSPHGITWTPDIQARIAPPDGSLRVANLGRLDRAKGTAVLIRALRVAPDAAVRLDVFGVEQQDGAGRAIARLAAGDSRVRLHRAIPRDAVIPALADFDVVAVPSQGLETGPLVALEAFAAGAPVVASRLENLQHLIDHEVNGLLVSDYASETAWAAALCRLADDRELVERLRRGVRPPREACAAAGEMVAVYQSLIGDTRVGQSTQRRA